MKNPYLFVYGTLRQDSGHPMHQLLREHSEFVCRAWILGQLYQIHDYPGVVQSGLAHERVYGEIYKLLSPVLIEQLDDFEECSAAFPPPHEYIRKQVSAFVSGTKTITAWAYIYNYPVDPAKRILSGDFNQR